MLRYRSLFSATLLVALLQAAPPAVTGNNVELLN
jgi:hypothetical protein